MGNIIRFALFVCAALAMGLVSAQLVVNGRAGVFTQAYGAWQTWPGAGASDMDPYTRAHFLAQRRLPITPFETIEFLAATDDQGRTLDASCRYILTGTMPVARWWSLTSYTGKTRDGSKPGALSSLDTVYESDGHLKITASQTPQTGNWLTLPDSGDFFLVLRIYNAVTIAEGRNYGGALFSISREECR